MSRREIVLLVSHAIAALQLISALFVVLFSLPQQIFILAQAIRMSQNLRYPSSGTFQINSSQWMSLAFTLGRIILMLGVAALFWKCGPSVERFLLPTETAPDDHAAEPI